MPPAGRSRPARGARGLGRRQRALRRHCLVELVTGHRLCSPPAPKPWARVSLFQRARTIVRRSNAIAFGKTETVHRGLSRRQPVPVARYCAARGKIRFSANRRSKIMRPARWIRRTLVRGSIGGDVVYQVARRISTPRRPSRRWRSQKPGSRCAKEASIRPPALMLSRVFLIGRVRSSVAGTVVGASALWSIVFMVGAPRLRCETSGQDTHRGSSHRIGHHQ